MAIWRLGALGEKAACEEMHFSGNQHTPCQTLIGLSTVATSPDGKPRGGGRTQQSNGTSAAESSPQPRLRACSCLRASFDVKPDR
jgi:hypothetical protein